MADDPLSTDERAELAELRQKVARLTKINRVLMERVEQSMDLQGNAFSLFQAATVLEREVQQRTAALVRSNEDLRAAKEAADAANRAKSAFLANMSHEIRTPMNGVVGLADLLLESELSVAQRRLVGSIQRSADALLGVINDILDYSKIEAGRVELERVELDVVELVEQTTEVLSEGADKRGLSLVCLVDRAVPRALFGDPTRLRQIVTNLVGNAIKFTERGDVTLEVRLLREDDAGVELVFEVNDTGIGIPAEAIDRIFESFQQADGSTTRRFGGTGLGLAITRQLVKLHHGELGVESEVGVGSRFWFTARFSATAAARATAAELEGLTVALVELGGNTGAALERFLAGRGARVVRGADAEIAERVAAGAVRLDAVIVPTRQVVERWAVLAPGRSFVIGKPSGALPTGASELRRPVATTTLLRSLALASGRNPGPQRRSSVIALATPTRVSFSLRVLVAEDNAVNQKVAVGLLTNMGCSVEVACDGAEAVAAALREPFDLVLMDCQMPVLDGYGATEQIRRAEEAAGAHTWIVALTANAMAGDRERCLASGMDDFLSKPFRAAELKALLERTSARATAGRTRSSPP